MVRILVVDDEESVRAVAQRLLTLHGYAVDSAEDGLAAIDQLQRASYDLLIIDRIMPKMSGLEAIALIRTSPSFKNLKILMVTHASVTKEVDEAFEAGADGYVVKPYDMEKLLAKVRAILEG